MLCNAGLRARQRKRLHRTGHEEPLALLASGCEHDAPADFGGRRRENLIAAHDSTRIERCAFAVTGEERPQGTAHRAAQLPLQRWPLTENPRGRKQILDALAHPFARRGHGELDARKAFGLREAAQRADTENRHRSDGEGDENTRGDGETAGEAGEVRFARPLEGRETRLQLRQALQTGDAARIPLRELRFHAHVRRRRAPSASTTVLTTNVNTASSINNDATANAPTRSYSS